MSNRARASVLAGLFLASLLAPGATLAAAPVAGDDVYATPQDTTLVVAAPGVLANDTGTGTLTAVKVTDPAHGSVTLNSDGSLSYVPTALYNGPDSFTYKANDGSLTSLAATVTITVSAAGVPLPADVPPVCANAAASTLESAVLHGAVSCVDVDGPHALTYRKVSDPANGTLSIATNGSYTYLPGAGFGGTDSFTFTANDGMLDSNVATVTITVVAVGSYPDARNDTVTVVQGSGPTPLAILANDVPRPGPGEILTISAVTPGKHGSITITGGGSGLTYDPVGLYLGSDLFSYTILDGHGGTDTAYVLVTVITLATVPIATPVAGSTLGTSSVSVRIRWSAMDIGPSVKSYQLQESRGGGPFNTVVLAGPKSTSAVRTILLGSAYRWRVRATDVAGYVGSWATSASVTPARTQESAPTIIYTGSWPQLISPLASGGKTRSATAAGAAAAFTFTGRAVAWVSPTSLTRGSARVYVDGALVATVSLRSTSTVARRLTFSRGWSAGGPHVLRIEVVGTAGGPRVDVDAFVVLR
jgi:hypothetical protein